MFSEMSLNGYKISIKTKQKYEKQYFSISKHTFMIKFKGEFPSSEIKNGFSCANFYLLYFSNT